jgi:XkdW protein
MYKQIIEAYPELIEQPEIFKNEIVLRDDSDGQGLYIEKWEYSKPLPEGMKVGKN